MFRINVFKTKCTLLNSSGANHSVGLIGNSIFQYGGLLFLVNAEFYTFLTEVCLLYQPEAADMVYEI